MRRNAVAWAALALSAAALVGSRNVTNALPAGVPGDSQKVAKDLSRAFEAVADFVKPSVVQISVQKRMGGNLLGRGGARRGNPPVPNGRDVDPRAMEEMLRRFFGPNGPPEGFKMEEQGFERMAQGTGSGFIFDEAGHILTNNHVVDGANKLTVTFSDGVEAPATVVGRDPETDVAVIKVENTSYRPVARGNTKDLRVGDWVLAFGSPFGLSQTVTAGIVSATGRDNVDINRFESFIQTDAAINPGNSGGPLVDMDGKVVGINSAIATGADSRGNAGVGFTIPIEMAIRRAEKLIKSGKIESAAIGLVVEPLTPALASQLGMDAKSVGVVVTEVYPGSPAAKAGLKEGDVVTQFDGNRVGSRKALQYLVSSSDLGASYPLTYVRRGETKTAQVAPQSIASLAKLLGEGRDRETPEPKAVARPSGEPAADYGLSVVEATPELAEKYGYQGPVKGLIVTAVKDGGAAQAAGIEEGDLVTQFVRDKTLQQASDPKAFLDHAKGADQLSLIVRDSGEHREGTVITLSKPAR